MFVELFHTVVTDADRLHLQIYEYLHELSKVNRTVCTLIKVGKSYEGREILVLKIATGPSPKPIIWLDSREF